MTDKKDIPYGYPPGYYRYTYQISESQGEPYGNQTHPKDFWLNVTMRAAGQQGNYVYHTEGDQNITISSIRCYENTMLPALSGNVTIHITGILALTTAITLPYGASAVYNMGMWHVNFTVTVENQGSLKATFNVTVYYDSNAIETKTVINLAPGTSTTLTFTWYTAGATPSTYDYMANKYIPYKISVKTTLTVPFYDGTIVIRIVIRLPGDANGDGHVRGDDLGFVGASWYQSYPSPNYWWQADFNGDGTVKGDDLGILGWYWYVY